MNKVAGDAVASVEEWMEEINMGVNTSTDAWTDNMEIKENTAIVIEVAASADYKAVKGNETAEMLAAALVYDVNVEMNTGAEMAEEVIDETKVEAHFAPAMMLETSVDESKVQVDMEAVMAAASAVEQAKLVACRHVNRR